MFLDEEGRKRIAAALGYWCEQDEERSGRRRPGAMSDKGNKDDGQGGKDLGAFDMSAMKDMLGQQGNMVSLLGILP